MSIFHRKVHNKESAPQSLDINSNDISSEAIQHGKTEEMEALASPSGVISKDNAQLAQVRAIDSLQAQSEITASAGAAAEEAGQAALVGAGIQQEPAAVDVQHRLSA